MQRLGFNAEVLPSLTKPKAIISGPMSEEKLTNSGMDPMGNSTNLICRTMRGGVSLISNCCSSYLAAPEMMFASSQSISRCRSSISFACIPNSRATATLAVRFEKLRQIVPETAPCRSIAAFNGKNLVPGSNGPRCRRDARECSFVSKTFTVAEITGLMACNVTDAFWVVLDGIFRFTTERINNQGPELLK